MKFFSVIWTVLCLWPTGVVAKNVTIGMGNFAPYYISEGQTGIFTDVITAVFKNMPDHQPVYLFGRPNNRLWDDFKKGKIDAVSNLFDSVKLEGCRSDPIFRFHDVAVTKSKVNISLKKISDLAGKRIITFQGAKGFFGDEFANFTNFKSYTEVAKPNLQARMLYSGRADVSVGDMFIFLHTLKTSKKAIASPTEFNFHDIFKSAISRMGFREQEVCALFNKSLKKIRHSGEYENIYRSYLKNYGL